MTQVVEILPQVRTYLLCIVSWVLMSWWVRSSHDIYQVELDLFSPRTLMVKTQKAPQQGDGHLAV